MEIPNYTNRADTGHPAGHDQANSIRSRHTQQHICDYPLSAARLCCEILKVGFGGKYTAVKNYLRAIWPREAVQAAFRSSSSDIGMQDTVFHRGNKIPVFGGINNILHFCIWLERVFSA